jgi:inner membrane protein
LFLQPKAIREGQGDKPKCTFQIDPVENLSHSLIGAVLAEAALPRTATPRQRTAFYITGILAANLPDADLLYTSILEPPLGYLLHHRGHTHTVAGLLGLAALIGMATLIPAFRRLIAEVRRPFWTLVAAALASHLIADSWNSYGVHPFWPIDNRWFYGDAIYILEPWLWALLGVSVVLNARTKAARLLVAGLLIALPSAGVALGVIARGTLLPLAVAAAAMVAALRSRAPSTRAWTSLAAMAAFVLGSFGIEQLVRRNAMRSLGSGAEVVDVVLSPRPANPLCWTALAIQRREDSLQLSHSVMPAFGAGCRAEAWRTAGLQSITQLTGLARRNCRVRAWLQFGRAPLIAGDWIGDARYGGSSRGNFSAMAIASGPSGSECPARLTAWKLPRADVLTGIQ